VLEDRVIPKTLKHGTSRSFVKHTTLKGETLDLSQKAIIPYLFKVMASFFPMSPTLSRVIDNKVVELTITINVRVSLVLYKII